MRLFIKFIRFFISTGQETSKIYASTMKIKKAKSRAKEKGWKEKEKERRKEGSGWTQENFRKGGGSREKGRKEAANNCKSKMSTRYKL